jgi:hypothetical protein
VPLNITKVAVGCAEIGTLRDRLSGRARGGESFVVTRYKPKRAEDLAGGSLYWIIKHRLVARSPILGFIEDPDDARRIRIIIAEDLVPIRAIPKRAHQGWRYLEPADAPADLGDGEAEGLSALPDAMAAELAALALI